MTRTKTPALSPQMEGTLRTLAERAERERQEAKRYGRRPHGLYWLYRSSHDGGTINALLRRGLCEPHTYKASPWRSENIYRLTRRGRIIADRLYRQSQRRNERHRIIVLMAGWDEDSEPLEALVTSARELKAEIEEKD